jgi:hypothetical protein
MPKFSMQTVLQPMCEGGEEKDVVRRLSGEAGISLLAGNTGYSDRLFVDGLYGSACKEIFPFNGSNSGSL